jgi:hypothetical protein
MWLCLWSAACNGPVFCFSYLCYSAPQNGEVKGQFLKLSRTQNIVFRFCYYLFKLRKHQYSAACISWLPPSEISHQGRDSAHVCLFSKYWAYTFCWKRRSRNVVTATRLSLAGRPSGSRPTKMIALYILTRILPYGRLNFIICARLDNRPKWYAFKIL